MAQSSGIDVSKFQPRVDWFKVRAAGQRYVFARATFGVVIDPLFMQHVRRAQDAGLLASAYHFFRPQRPLQAQIDAFCEALGDFKPDLPVALDVETNGADTNERKTPDEIAAGVRGWLSAVEAHLGRRPLIYTAASVWNRNLPASPDWAGYDLWIANYTNRPAPSLPRDWTTWRFWQYTQEGRVDGIGVPVDLNRFNGDDNAVIAYAGKPAQAAGLRARVLARTLNIRSGAGADFPDIGDLTRDRIVPVLEIDGLNAWLQAAPDQWAAVTINGERFMEFISAEPLQARVTVPVLNLRAGPAPAFDDVGDLRRGDVVTARGVGGRDCWVRIADGEWAAFSANGRELMEIVA